MTRSDMLIKACFLVLALAAANEDNNTCAASPGGCAGKNEADANTLIQSRVRISGGLAPDLNAQNPLDSDLGDAGVDIDHMGLLEADGSEPTEHVQGEEIGPFELDEDGDSLDYANDPTKAPYLEELMELDRVSQLEEAGTEVEKPWGATLADDTSDPSEPPSSVKEYAAALKEALAPTQGELVPKDDVKKHIRAKGRVDEHKTSMLGESMLVAHESGFDKIIKVAVKTKCRVRETYVGNFPSVAKCAEEVLKEKMQFFIYGANQNCYIQHTKTTRCPEGFESDPNYDFYHVYDNAKTSIFEVWPQEGSIAGGQLVTIEGVNLYAPHNEMKGTGATASSLRSPIQIFFVDPATGFRLECPLETFESREESVKCVTPSVANRQNLTDTWLQVLVFKRTDKGAIPAERPGDASLLKFRYSFGATPTLAKVEPTAVGAGEILTLQAWSCSGIVEAEPILLIPVGSSKNKTVNPSGEDAEDIELVKDPEEAWGHVCDPYPSFSKRYMLVPQADEQPPSDEERGMTGAPADLGAPGLDSRYFELQPSTPFPDNANKIMEFLKQQEISAGRRFIRDRPYLPYNTRYFESKKPYVATLGGFLKVSVEGNYEFRVNTLDVGIIKVGAGGSANGGGAMLDTRRRKTAEAGWGHWELWTAPLNLHEGWHKISVAHAARMHHERDSALEVRYKGPDTSNRWEIIPPSRLRAGIDQKTVDQMDKENNEKNADGKYLIPAKEILTDKLDMGPGKLKCPGGEKQKYVEFMCKVSTDMQAGFYNMEFRDHRFGASVAGAAQWDTGMGAERATVRVVASVRDAKEWQDGKLLVQGAGLDGLATQQVHYNNFKYEHVNGTQDHLELQKGTPAPNTASLFGGRGLLREMWYQDRWPDESDAMMDPPSWMRASSLKSTIQQADSMGSTGFSERLTGLFTPPYSGTCRFRMQGTQKDHRETGNQAALYISKNPIPAYSEPVAAPPDLAREKAIFLYGGGAFDGSYHINLHPYFPKQIGGAFTVAFSARWDEFVAWNRIIDFGNKDHDNIRIIQHHTQPHLRFEVGQGRHISTHWAHDAMTKGKEIDIMWTVTDKGYSEVWINGIFKSDNANMKVPSKMDRRNMYIGRSSSSDLDGLFKGSIRNLKWFDKVVSYYDAFGAPKKQVAGSAITAKIVKPDHQCRVHNEHLGNSFGSPAECAEEVAKRHGKFFIFGKKNYHGRCYKQHVTGFRCTSYGFDWNFDFFQVNLNIPKAPSGIVYPSEPAVRTDYANEKSSPWMNFEEGKSYPFKLERHLAGRSETTGVQGWKKLGLECKSLSSVGSVNKAPLLPRASYQVSMKLKEYPVVVTLPKSETGYKLAFKGREAPVTTDSNAGQGLMSLFGARCTVTKDGGADAKVFGFEEKAPRGEAYCGVSDITPKTTGDGAFDDVMLVSESQTGRYKLRDFPFLHMCSKIAPNTVVNMVVRAKVGYRGHMQEFSIGMTDPRFADFNKNRKRAGQWAAHTKADGSLDGAWHCDSINLQNMVVDYESYERRFEHVEYNRGAVDTHRNAPNFQLSSNVFIYDIKLASAYMDGGRWQPLKGTVSIDQFVVSKSEYQISQSQPSPMAVYPFKAVEGQQTSAGWKVEWFGGYRNWLGKYQYKDPSGRKPDAITLAKEVNFGQAKNQDSDNCRAAWPTRRCDNYGWRATGIIDIPSAGDWYFHYAVDDDMYIFVQNVNDPSGKVYESGHLRCCTGWSYRRVQNAFALKKGQYRVEVHFYEGGGGDYGGFKWQKHGESTFHTQCAPGGGVSMDHKVTFKPSARKEFANLKKMLGEITVDGEPIIQTLPNGQPAQGIVKVTEPPKDVTGSWTSVVKVRQRKVEQDQNATFNELFAKCPVVRYMRDDEVSSIYVRTSTIPALLDAHKLFTESWKDTNNKFNTDFKIYSNMQDISKGSSWQYCSFNENGYPSKCGKTGRSPDYWFRMPNLGGVRGAITAGFEVFDGSDCPSAFGSASGAATQRKSVTFDMDETDQSITEKIKAAGLPAANIRVAGRGGLKWLNLKGAPTYQSSTYNNYAASKALDGNSNQNARDNSCAHTDRDRNPWWIAKLGGTYEVSSVQVYARSDGGAHEISGFTLSVDGKACAENVHMNQGEVKNVPCAATGSSLMIHMPGKNEHLVICEVKVAVVDDKAVSSGPKEEAEAFTFEATNSVRGGSPTLIFESDLATSIDVTTTSNGARFWRDVTDFWFRMPYNKQQIELGDWRSYIETGVDGTAPKMATAANNSNAPMTLFQMSHSVRGNVAHTVRRDPSRRWRLPARYHTEETLEALKRRVLGTHKSPEGWAETASLLQLHADSDQHAAFKEGKVDPRDDPHALRWSDKASWGGEDPPTGATSDIIYFPEGKTGMLDMNINIRFWVIEGNLVWDQSKDISMGAVAVVVNGGQFLIGKESAPYAMKGLFTLHGHWHTMKLPLCGSKTIFQTMGNIEMHGVKVPVTWTDLSETAQAGSKKINVRDSVNWAPGAMLVVAASDKIVKDCRLDRRDECQVEERYVLEVTNGGKTIELDRPLVFRHVGEALNPHISPTTRELCKTRPALCDDTQVRAEVGLLSRNLVVKGSNYEDGSGPAGSEGFGAHLMHAVKAQYTFIEFHWMGQAFQMGRYPLHLHLTGLNPDSKILGCSLHRTFQRGITVHGTHSSLIKDNILYNHLSHGFFIEDGNEHNNIFDHNLGMMTHPSYSMLMSDQTPATFWIRNPSNYFRNNHAAGSHSFGFWFDTLGEAHQCEQKEFANNVAHSNGKAGIWADIVDPLEGCQAPDSWTISVPFLDSDAISRPVHKNKPECAGLPRKNSEFLSTTTWGNGEFGMVLFEVGHIHVINHRSVSDPNGLVVWGLRSDNWADETNNWYGPLIKNGAYHTKSALTEKGFDTKIAIGGPWDDTLFISDTQFIGPFSEGTFMPCFFCLVAEGGYEMRTSKLGWHEGAGTASSVKVHWPWLYASFFFDFDGTLTEDTTTCKLNGCYLHSSFRGNKAGMYQRKALEGSVLPAATSTTSAAPSATTPLLPPSMLTDEDEQEEEHEIEDHMVVPDDQVEHEDGTVDFPDFPKDVELHQDAVQSSAASQGRKCLKSLVGHYQSNVVPDLSITASSTYGNRGDHGKGEMFRSRVGYPHTSWVAWHNNKEQWIEWQFGSAKWITGVQTQGRQDSDSWVMAYNLKCSPDGTKWEPVANGKTYDGNRDRNSVKEHRIVPIKCMKMRLEPQRWHGQIALRADFLGCPVEQGALTKVCMDKPFLDDKQRDCRVIEREAGDAGMKTFCAENGHRAWFTALSANQACCTCGGGVDFYAQAGATFNQSKAIPKEAPVKVMPGGTAYLPPDKCRVVDATGGIVCDRSVRMQSITIKNAGIWQEMQTIDVQSDWGFSQLIYVGCYGQYEFTLIQDARHMLVPPYTPKALFDWDRFDATVKLRAGDHYVLQWETLHNPDGYTVHMPGQTKRHTCDNAPIQYAKDFFTNTSLLNEVSKDRDMHSAKELNVGLALDMYKMAHKPLLDIANNPDAAGSWGYIQANESYVMHEWYPGAFQLLISDKGLEYSRNHYGAWNGYRKNIMEKMVTRPINSGTMAAKRGFSHIETKLSWSRWDQAAPASGAAPLEDMSRLEYLAKYCDVNPASFGHLGADAVASVSGHKAVTEGKLKVGQLRKFKWSEWPADLGGKPKKGKLEDGFGNVTIEQNWEVTLDEDVDFINKLNISGVLKFEDKAGCCKLVARYIWVGPLFGRLEAGSRDSPIAQGLAHIVLKGHPLTPNLKTFRPHLVGSAKWLKNKFIAVMGKLSLYGEARTKTWVRLKASVQSGTKVLQLEDNHNFKAGDKITIHQGLETKTIASVEGSAITLTEEVQNAYRGMDHKHLNREDTKGLMAVAVGLIEGHKVVVEGEDTPGVPMCDKDENRTCPYSKGFPGGVSLHDFAKEMRHYLETTGAASHPNCRPCLAVSEQSHGGYIIAMAHFHAKQKWCPKDHGTIEVSGVSFKHASSINFYHRYNGASAFPFDQSYTVAYAWNNKGRQHTWWKDPVWPELKLANLETPINKVVKSGFNNTHCGSAFAAATAGLYETQMQTISDNIFLTGGVGLNGAAREGGASSMTAWNVDKTMPMNDNTATLTMGVGSNDDAGDSDAKKKMGSVQNIPFRFEDNFMSGAWLISLGGAIVKNNMLMGRVSLQGSPVATKEAAKFVGNTVHNSDGSGCVRMMTSGSSGISDSVVYGCRNAAVGFAQASQAEGVLTRMTILDSAAGVYYFNNGPDSRRHDMTQIEFQISDTKLYAKSDGSGIGIQNPKVHSVIQGEPLAPDWWNAGATDFLAGGHSAVSLYFRTKISGVTWIGYDHTKGGRALTVGIGGARDTSDQDYYPMMVSGLKFESMADDAKLYFATSTGAGFGNRQCIQIDCDGRRNTLIIDEDGSLLGSPGTVIPLPQKFYDKFGHVEPMGFENMEDLIPMPARYDRFGDAIPFPTGVDHGTGGGLEYKCNKEGGCPVLYMSKGLWIPKRQQTLPKDTRIVAIREDGGLIRLDPLHHGWAYATGWVRTSECTKTMDPKDTAKPESQHARRYGRAAAGEFGAHRNTSRITATKGPVYTKPGVYREGCVKNDKWQAYKCPGGKHRHLLIEVMDWNHQVRRWAPVSVEVNDKYAPQGGYMNIMSGPAMYWDTPALRLQTFHALGHLGLRHNIYFSADPPQHLRLHLQYAAASDGVIACVYYGIPNNIVAYVKGQRKEAPLSMTPSWDNLVFKQLEPGMEHGTFYYDRIGAETGRPGYLYAVVRGSQHVDFKISHKVVLTSKIKVDTSWGGWKNDDGDNFYKKGIDGLVRNIALLIGVPPSRIKILGNGTATKGTFWNEKTTSTKFAEWMWKQNKSMDKMDMTKWLQAPGAELPDDSKTEPESLLQANERHVSFLSQFAEHRHETIRAALARHGGAGERWHHHLVFLTSAEREAVHRRRAEDDLAAQGDVDMAALQDLQKAKEDSDSDMVKSFEADLASRGEMVVNVEADEEDHVPSAGNCPAGKAEDCAALDEHSYNTGEMTMETDTMKLANLCKHDPSAGGCTLPNKADQGDSKTEVLAMSVDNVPTKTNPLGWSCNADTYKDARPDIGKDGICDCECGIWDPDCEPASVDVLALNNGTSSLSLLDSQQGKAVINWLDSDGNGNGVLDGMEIAKINSLGMSALYGVAERIVEAQEFGGNIVGEFRKGNFAHLQAQPSSSCNYLLNSKPFPEGAATYTPVCVKDVHWKTLIGQPTGRCGLLPKMKTGSQCQVPGSGIAPNPVSFNGSLTGTKSVCGTMMQIFPTGGAGGILAAGVGVSSAKYHNNGGNFMPGVAGDSGYMQKLDFSNNFMTLKPSFKHGMSFFAKVKFESFTPHSRIFSFGARNDGDQRSSARFEAYVTNHNWEDANKASCGLEFFVRSQPDEQNRWGRSGTVKANGAARANEADAFLFVYNTPKKQIEIWRNGIQLNTASLNDVRMNGTIFKSLMVGNVGYNAGHVNGLDGAVTDIRVWDRAVEWDSAVAGTPPGEDPTEASKEQQGEVDAKCITSMKNSWDFVCDSELPEEMATSFGYGDVANNKKVKAFKKREHLGELATCGNRISAKAVIYQGKFGDGLTAEYFKLRTNCNLPPFLFGTMPTMVRVDPLVRFTGAEFHAPFNELAIRWTGKILIDQTGNYDFSVTADDAAWVAIDGRLLVDLPGCGSGNSQSRTKEASRKLEKGAHDISVLYMNKGPQGQHPGEMELKYKGADTGGALLPVPTAKLGSAPLRLAKLAKELGKDKNHSVAAVIPGAFIYDDENRVGIMPVGSCGLKCRRGERKAAGAYFKFFCPTSVEGNFAAKVNMNAKSALMWLDNGDSMLWRIEAQKPTALEQEEAKEASSATALTEDTATAEEMLSSSLGLDDFKLNEDPGPMIVSKASQNFTLSAGEHTLVLQGRPERDEFFALADLRLTGAASVCSFYLEGRDKTSTDCL